MSIFSKIKRSKKAAKEHKVQAAEREKEDEIVAQQPVKYKHIPTHAAVDALSGAPSSWKAEDRPKIKEHHKRRSEMHISRTGSTLSTGSYMSSGTPPQLPRHASYSSFNPTWNDRMGDLNHLSEPKDRVSKHGKQHPYHDSGFVTSPLASHVQSEANSTVTSSGNSTTSSSDNLPELHIASSVSTRPQPTTFVERDIFQRLHTSTTRKVGESPLAESPPQILSPKITATVVTQETKAKKPRWSMMNKKNALAAA